MKCVDGYEPLDINTGYHVRSDLTDGYVANSGSNAVSVIDVQSNTVVKSITVGVNPSFIESFRDAIYVANSGSPLTNEEVAGMKFDIKPFGAGQRICDGLDAPINRFMYVSSGAKCIDINA